MARLLTVVLVLVVFACALTAATLQKNETSDGNIVVGRPPGNSYTSTNLSLGDGGLTYGTGSGGSGGGINGSNINIGR
uniref:Uncharacterized protein n=1 Tax=Heliothis virescens TaxID=7102 RepID=A0A2A4J1Q2_HELVI